MTIVERPALQRYVVEKNGIRSSRALAERIEYFKQAFAKKLPGQNPENLLSSVIFSHTKEF
jgi:hypothetical protein